MHNNLVMVECGTIIANTLQENLVILQNIFFLKKHKFHKKNITVQNLYDLLSRKNKRYFYSSNELRTCRTVRIFVWNTSMSTVFQFRTKKMLLNTNVTSFIKRKFTITYDITCNGNGEIPPVRYKTVLE